MSLLKRLKEIVDSMEEEQSSKDVESKKENPETIEPSSAHETQMSQEKTAVELPDHYLQCNEIESSEIILLNHEMKKIKEELASLVYDYEVKKQFLITSNLQKTAAIKELVEQLRIEYGLPTGNYKVDIPDDPDQKQVITFIEVEK